MEADKVYLPELDGLRALAVIAVMIYHADFPYPLPFELGTLGVSIFFVLSGFLITKSLLRTKEKNDTFASYFVARAGRIFPLYFLVCLPILAYYHWPPSTKGFCLYYFNLNVNTQGFVGSPPHPLLHLWTLSIEEQFYCVWPFVVYFMPINRVAFLLISIGIAWTVYAGHWASVTNEIRTTPDIVVASYTLSYLPVLVIGSLIAVHYKRIRQNPKILVWIICASLVMNGLLLVLFGSEDWGGLMANPSRSLSVATGVERRTLTAIALFCIVLQGNKRVTKFLSSKIFKNIAAISYGLYLFHYVFYSFLRLHWNSIAGTLWSIGVIIITFIVSYLAHHYFADPIRDKAKKFAARYPSRLPFIDKKVEVKSVDCKEVKLESATIPDWSPQG